MKRLIILCILLIIAGCQHGDLKISSAIKGQPVLQEGYNIGPELYLEEGDIAVVTGAVVWIKGLDPNTLYGE